MRWSTLSFLAVVIILTLALAHPTRAAQELKDTSWQVMYIGSYHVAPGQSKNQPQVIFGGQGRVSGSTGCNHFTGVYQQDGNSLKFSPLAMTKMACPPPDDALERAFIQAMAATASVRQQGNKLEFLDALGNVQMQLQK